MKSMEEKAIEIAKLMVDGKGNDVTLLDISGLNSWTDYFVIVTVTSSTHWQGLYKQIKEYIKDNDIPVAQLYLAPPLSTNDLKGLEELSSNMNFFYNAISDKNKINKKNRNSLIEISLEERQK